MNVRQMCIRDRCDTILSAIITQVREKAQRYGLPGRKEVSLPGEVYKDRMNRDRRPEEMCIRDSL